MDKWIEESVVECTGYTYSHYRYVDSNGNIQYAPNCLEDVECTYEELFVESKLKLAGFLEDDTSYYSYNDQTWYKQTAFSGERTVYIVAYKYYVYTRTSDWLTADQKPSGSKQVQSAVLYKYANTYQHAIMIVGDSNQQTMLLLPDGATLSEAMLSPIHGYCIAGLFKDPDCTVQWDYDAPIVESLTLFVKYLPKTYHVVFQLKDGTELDTQTVEYMAPATEPDTDSVPGYVFGGWDKDFDCIVEDTVVTAKYFKETEYTRVALNYSEFMLYAGTDFNLVVTVTPAAVANERVEWTSSDPKIASVDDTGRVSAVSRGKATITVTAPKTGESASCVVTVNPNVSTQIVLTESTNLNHDDLGYLRRIGLKTPVSAIQGEFENLELHYYNIAGTELADSAYIGTGSEIRLTDGESILDTEVCVVTGDATGDGIINNRDVVLLNRMILQGNTADLKECQLLAMDVNGDGKINNRDAVIVAKYIVGKQAL